jgi:cobalamin biosynthesis Mg chelatase CobN
LQFLPGDKVRDLRNWLTIYGATRSDCRASQQHSQRSSHRNWRRDGNTTYASKPLSNAGYWNAGGQQNVESMLTYLTQQYLQKLGAAPAAMVETPATGAAFHELRHSARRSIRCVAPSPPPRRMLRS